MTWIIEEGKTKDIESIAQFQVDMAIESEGTILNKELVLKGVAEGMKDPEKGTYLVARNNTGEAIGSLLLTREWSDWNCAWYWWIQSVYVRPEYRRKGVYRAMYDAVKQKACVAKVSCVRLYVDRTNQRGLSTYNALGMHESHYLLYEENLD
ncbi:MAG: GNAT family N-acetyltransferase [Prevotellaceae bacterium]|nr:GNAT family N-acetyltransferase [Candidatus Minthosoma caballi]